MSRPNRGFVLAGALVTVDVASPAFPVELGSRSIGDAAMDVSVVSGVAHVAARSLGLVTFDVVDPSSPIPFDGLPTGREAAYELQISHGRNRR